LFKLHPDFDAAIAQILLVSPENTVVVLIAEKIFEWNEAIFTRIKSALEAAVVASTVSVTLEAADASLEMDQAAVGNLVARFLAKLRFVSYNYYADLLLTAHVVLDTFPYGGKKRSEPSSDFE
jgi:heme oxygenase